MALSLKSFYVRLRHDCAHLIHCCVLITLKIAAKYSVLSLLAVHHEVMVMVERPVLHLLLLHLLQLHQTCQLHTTQLEQFLRMTIPVRWVQQSQCRYTVKLLIQAGSQIEAGSPIQAGGFRSLVSIEARSPIQAG